MLPKDHCVYPDEEVETTERRDEHEPEPYEDEDLFVEKIDGQHTLDSVVVYVGHLPDLEEAMRDPGEAGRLGP